MLYDEDNIDLEEEMYLNDIAEEQYLLDNPEEDEEEIDEMDREEDFDSDSGDADQDSDENTPGAKKKEKVRNIEVSEKYLDEQLKINIETYRDNIRFKYNDEVYIGKVIHKMRTDCYIFSVHLEGSDEITSKMFKCSKMKKVS
jgi:hypothetical protein